MARAAYRNNAITHSGLPVNIIPNATVTLYEAGTTTPLGQTIYAAATGGTTLPNPHTTDADGNIVFFLDSPQDVKVVVTGVGVGTLTADWERVPPAISDLVVRNTLVNDASWALSVEQQHASGKMFRLIDPSGNTALRVNRSAGGRNVLWLLEPAADAADTEESLLVVSATSTTLIKMVALGLTVNGGGVDVGPFSSIVSRTSGALAHIRAGEFHALLLTGATAGPSWGLEVGGHYQVAGPSPDYNVGVNIQSWLFGLASGVAGNTALWAGGALGWDQFFYAAHTDGTMRWKLDNAGKITGGSYSPRTDSTFTLGSSTSDAFLAIYGDFLIATSAGAANAPSKTWGTDTNTGWFNEPDVIGETTGGVERRRISSVGMLLTVPAILPQIATPSAPGASTLSVYSKTGAGLYSETPAGVEQQHKADGQCGFASGSTSGPTTVSSSYADLAQMSVTLTTKGGDLLVDFLGAFTHSDATKAIVIALSLDAAAEVFALAISVPVAAEAFIIPLMARFAGVAAGSHTVKVRWLTDGATATANGTDRFLRVQELPH